jgi:uncharacterized protein (DUF2249 family)
MAPAPLTLDVRTELRNGGEPLPQILQAVTRLQPEQPLRLLTTFEPIPLYAVLGRKGFGHVASRHREGDWEILFTPNGASANGVREQRPAAAAASASSADWPPPKDFLDNRGLLPPEPMIRILDALEHMAPGEVIEAINEREPMFLYPELEARGAAIQVEKQPDGAARLLIRRGG